jgi:hypothetical protein
VSSASATNRSARASFATLGLAIDRYYIRLDKYVATFHTVFTSG